MKLEKPTKVFFVFALVLVGVAVVLWFSYRSQPKIPEIQSDQRQPANLQEAEGKALSKSALETRFERNIKTKDSKLWEKDIKRRAEKLSELNRPINIFGRVVDDQNKPVSDVDISITISHFSRLLPLPSLGTLRVSSNSEGLFSIRNEEGLSATIESSKIGYKFPRASLYYEDGISKESNGISKDRPYVIRGYKIERVISKDLVASNKLYGLIPDGRYYTIDLHTGAKLPGKQGGDLWISAFREKGAKRQDIYNWSLTIEVNNGGIQETSGQLLYLAPGDGYKTSWTIQSKRSDGDSWKLNASQQFYARSRSGGTFSKLNIWIAPIYNDKNDFAIRIDSVANPTGSQALYNGR